MPCYLSGVPMTNDGQQRRYTRYRLQLPATLTHGRKTWRLQTDDISVGGVFLRVRDPPGLRQLVRVEVALPAGGALDTHGMVVWRLAPDAGVGREAGVGVQFFALAKQDAQRWEALVKDLKRFSANAPSMEPPAPAEPEAEPERRRYPRHGGVFEIRPKDSAVLMTMFTSDVSAGGVFVRSSQVAPVGAEIEVDLVHPGNEAVFALTAVVRRVEAGEGLGIEFIDVDRGRRSLLWQFIRSGLGEPSYDVVDDDGLPRL